MSRKNRARRSSRYGFLQSIFFVTVFLAAAYVLARSSVFEVRGITVTGNVSLSRDSIVAASGINLGENIFKINLKSAAEKIRLIPLVKSVDMSRRLPSVVEIKVEERKAVALLPVDTGFIQVDDEGVYINKGNIGSGQLPVITGVKFAMPSPGGHIKSDQLDTALAVVKGLPPELIPQLSEVNVNGDQVTVYTLDGVQCRLGTSQDVGQKGEVLLKVIGSLKEKGKRIEYIDLTCAGSPVVKYTG